jgi:hypothetical protein
MTCLTLLDRRKWRLGRETVSVRGDGAVKCLEPKGSSREGATPLVVVVGATRKQPPYLGALWL